MIVVAGTMMDLAAGMAALDLDRRMADGKFPAQPALELSHDVFRFLEPAIAHHHVAAERHLLR
jgi:hypothetical protein